MQRDGARPCQTWLIFFISLVWSAASCALDRAKGDGVVSRIGGSLRLLMITMALAMGTTAALAEDDPDLFSIGAGFYDQGFIDPNIGFLDVSETDNREEAADFRLEYRFGNSLVPFIDPYAKLKPWIGAEFTSDGAVYGVGGVLLDVPVGPFVFTPSFGAGLYADGAGKDLGSVLEFRTQFEVGYQFENQSRFSLSYSHISNADISDTNPGTNILSLYYHLPSSWIFGAD